MRKVSSRKVSIGAMKVASVAQALKGALVGRALRPSEKAYVRKFVTESGAPVRSSGSLLRNLLIGPRESLKIMESRMAQGGLLGKGGLIRGELAPSIALRDTVRRLNNPEVGYGSVGSTYTMPGDVARLAGHGASYGLHLGLGLGLPALGISQALKSDRAGEGIGRSLGEGAGYLAGGPLGLAGAITAGVLGGEAGSSVGKAVDSSEDQLSNEMVYYAPSIDPMSAVPVYAN